MFCLGEQQTNALCKPLRPQFHKDFCTMKRDDAPLSHLYSPAIKYLNKLKKAEVIDSDMANRVPYPP